ncbi:MAG: hypothetical protein IPL53_24200 [Ignavibacteria bacterium]|nr:hypothetical protein [Ignavibacteria bacterium]
MAATGYFDSLYEYQPGKFQLKKKDGTKYFFDDSTHKKLTKISDRNNNELTITYTGSLATSITDPMGRSVQLNYTGGHLTSITDPNFTPTRQFLYSYDSDWNVISFTDPLGEQH